LVALGERFYAVLCQHPGETMTTLRRWRRKSVSRRGCCTQVAVARLRRDGRVHAIGLGHFWRASKRSAEQPPRGTPSSRPI
jgi:hypothetical protein